MGRDKDVFLAGAEAGRRELGGGAPSGRERLHQLVDELPSSAVATAERYLETLRGKTVEQEDPLLRALAEAPLDDEPETDEERAAVQEAREAHARGDYVTDEALRAEFGW